VTGTALIGAVVVATAAATGGLLARLLVPRLPEPDDGAGKIRYADLATPRFVAGCASAAGVATAVAWLTMPLALQPLWWVLATLGIVLAAVDARTTWLPLRLTRLAWAAMAVAGLGAAALGAGWPELLRAVVGAALAGLLYLLVWRLSRGGFGFGDVRFAPLVGAVGAAHSWSLLAAALLAGSLLGAAYGGLRLFRRRGGPFPYAPALVAGAYLACGAATLG
jgi:leader peptidase (prepilin peptidase) / N-methyltransferase